MKVDGRCHCGRIAYQAEPDPAGILVCHCTDCQALSGSAFRTVAPTTPGRFRPLSGELTVYVKVAESGTRRQQTVGPECGSPIHSIAEGGEPKVCSLRVGTHRPRAERRPVGQIWRRSALPWLGELPAIPGRAQG
ncbi:GFA family protein [Elioraea sp.]|uniref:GFA family protein n=1 Tax=Elioraea sp. TaxID=2185103 RepID=UPI003F71A719